MGDIDIVENMKRPNIQTQFDGLPNLPSDIFVLVIQRLEAWDIVHCQKVSLAWRKAFTASEFLRIALKNYPNAREVRQLSLTATDPASEGYSNLQWRILFNKIACRYFHLTHGRYRSIQKYQTAISERLRLDHWFPVSPFEYHESQPGRRLCYWNPWEPNNLHHDMGREEQTSLYQHSFWSYEDGLLVFVPSKPLTLDYDAAELPMSKVSCDFAIMILDLESQRGVQIPFDISDKVVRNFRLRERTLIIEWAEKKAYHALNDSEDVHRHFASCYDISLHEHSGVDDCGRWKVTFRSEWKLHFLGLPLNTLDRFFSTHSKDHYAIYLWQPNRSMYSGDEEHPIESLLIYDISHSCAYLPSQDPGGKGRPGDIQVGPHLVSRMNYRDLQFFGVRQQSSPSLINFSLDSVQHSITIRENVRIVGQGYFDPAERLMCAKTTRILFQGKGPHLRQEWDGNLPPYRGNCSMESSDILESENWLSGIMDVVDHKADVRFSLAETVFTGRDIQNNALLRIRSIGAMATLDDTTTKQIAYMGKIAGDERFLIGQKDAHDVVVLRFD